MQPVVSSLKLQEFYTSERCFITEVLNTADYPALSVARARVEPGVTTERHYLTGTDEMYYILAGEGDMEIDGLPVGRVKPHDLVFIPMDTGQRIRNTGQEDLVFLCFCVPRFEQKNYH